MDSLQWVERSLLSKRPKFLQQPTGVPISYPKYYGRGGGWLAGEKNENEELGEKKKKGKEKGRKIT